MITVGQVVVCAAMPVRRYYLGLFIFDRVVMGRSCSEALLFVEL